MTTKRNHSSEEAHLRKALSARAEDIPPSVNVIPAIRARLSEQQRGTTPRMLKFAPALTLMLITLAGLGAFWVGTASKSPISATAQVTLGAASASAIDATSTLTPTRAPRIEVVDPPLNAEWLMHFASVHGAKLSPDGNWALVQAMDETRLFDVRAKRLTATFKQSTKRPQSARFSPNSAYLALLHDHNTLDIYSLETMSRTTIIDAAQIKQFELSNAHAIAVLETGHLKTFALTTGALVQANDKLLSASPNGVSDTSLFLNRQGTLLLLDQKNIARWYRFDNGLIGDQLGESVVDQATSSSGGQSNNVYFVPPSAIIGAGGDSIIVARNKVLREIDAFTGAVRHQVDIPYEHATVIDIPRSSAVAVDPMPKTDAAVGLTDGDTIKVDLTTGLTQTVAENFCELCTDPATDDGRQRIVLDLENNAINLVDMRDNSTTRFNVINDPAHLIALDRKQLIFARPNTNLQRLDTYTGTTFETSISLGLELQRGIRLDPSGDLVAGMNIQNEALRIVNIRDGRVVREFAECAQKSTVPVTQFPIAHTQPWFTFVGSDALACLIDSKISVYDISSGALRWRSAAGFRALAASRDGRLLVAGDGSAKVKIIDAATGDVRAKLLIGNAPHAALAFTPGGDKLLVIDQMDIVSMHDWQTGAVLFESPQMDTGPAPHGSPLIFSEDGRIIVRGTSSGAQIIDTRRLKSRQVNLGGESIGTHRLILSPDGKQLYIGTTYGDIMTVVIDPDVW